MFLWTCVGAKLPLYTFGIKAQTSGGSKKKAHMGSDDHCVPDDDEDPYERGDSQQENYFLDDLLLAQWEDRMVRGLFRYDVTACETKVYIFAIAVCRDYSKQSHVGAQTHLSRCLRPYTRAMLAPESIHRSCVSAVAHSGEQGLMYRMRVWQMLPGEYGFIAQLNEGRHTQKRPTEFRVDQVLQTFDPKKFNFTKVGQEEVLFQFGPSEDGLSEYYEKAPVLASPNVIAINVSSS